MKKSVKKQRKRVFDMRILMRKLSVVRHTIADHGASFGRRTRPGLPVLYALLLEATELGLLSFAALLTIEAVLPGLVSLRVNLAIPFSVILLLFTASAWIGRSLGLVFPFTPDKKSPLTWIGISWLAFLLTLSTIRFPFWSVPIIVGGMFVTAHLFWKLLFRSEKV